MWKDCKEENHTRNLQNNLLKMLRIFDNILRVAANGTISNYMHVA